MSYDHISPRIVVFGVGGAGGNAVDNMIDSNLQGVEFVAANTDAQALETSKSPVKLQLGLETTRGLGAGARPEIGEASAKESLEQIERILEGAHMVFIAAGMGGGTGTGAAPIIAKAAKDRQILTVAVVTKPFNFEGAHRMRLAERGLSEIEPNVDTMIVVPNQNLFRVANEKTTFAEAFRMADDVLFAGVCSITDLMTKPGLINLDFADVQTIMSSMGSAMIGMGEASGEDRAMEAAQRALQNPLLDDVSLKGAKAVLLNITGGYDMTLYELDAAASKVREEVCPHANIILGSAFDPDLDGKIRVSLVAAGLDDGKSQYAPNLADPARAQMFEPTQPAPRIPAPQAEAELPRIRASRLSQLAADMADTTDAYATVQRPSATEVNEEPAKGTALFGWRKNGIMPSDLAPNADTVKRPVQPRAEKEENLFEENLEIPSFLRRSGAH